MEHNYLSNPAIKLCAELIEPSSGEKEVQVLYENMLWTTYPASEGFMNVTKYKQGATEPDNKVMKIILFNEGYATMDLFDLEIKRSQEDISIQAFHRIAYNILDDHMSESTNPTGTTLFGGVAIELHICFYEKVLPDGRLTSRQSRPFHVINDAQEVQTYFDYFKQNIPKPLKSPATIRAAPQSGSSTFHGGDSPGSLRNQTSHDFKAESSTSASQTSAASEQYHYAKDQKYFLFNQGNHIPLPSRPKDVWVWNEKGWSETGRTKHWRKWDGKNVEFK